MARLVALLTALLVAGTAGTGCPEMCHCVPGEVSCVNAGLMQLPSGLENVENLRKLVITGNNITHLPDFSFSNLYMLEELDLSNNNVTTLSTHSLDGLSSLLSLDFSYNRISSLDLVTFSQLNSIRNLFLNGNRIASLPPLCVRLARLEFITLAYNRITTVPEGVFQQCSNLTVLELKGNSITHIEHNAFTELSRLKQLELSEARQLSVFPNFTGTSALEHLRIDRAGLTEIPDNICLTLPRLKKLLLMSNKLTWVPDLKKCHGMKLLNLRHNDISSLDKGSNFSSGLQDLILGYNVIKELPAMAFVGLHQLQVLELDGNQIEMIHEDAFLPLAALRDLNLGNNRFPVLPSRGLQNVVELKTFNNPNLVEFPDDSSFPRVERLVLSYAYHCCQFLKNNWSGGGGGGGGNVPPNSLLQEEVIFDYEPKIYLNGSTNYTSTGHLFEDIDWTNKTDSYPLYPGTLRMEVICTPRPGPFLPCRDLFDWWTLRCGVWIVFLLAMLGNGTVVFVLVFSRSKMDVPRFLVCNLAIADFFMGVYLGILAVLDASTLGEFRRFAISWQLSAGCRVAGFLGVLSSELSVYTLAVITMERNYAITHAMHLNKRLSLKHAAYIMAGGWTFALIMAILPLIGVSDYRKFAVCLPFETDGPIHLGYVVFLMLINGVAFLILMGCYLKMYCAIRGSQAWNSNDSRIAKRMALLVFTDFICWAPIAFFALTATFGVQLISLEEAKVFTVFILPLNSCCNPFLYAILTKQFKKDCVLICKAIEESRVTRGIGRCRHSSNFSNRQTPANTNNSLTGQNSSKDGQPCNCNVKLMEDQKNRRPVWDIHSFRDLLLCHKRPRQQDHSNDYTYQIAEIQQKQQKHKRASSVSSENFSSSRSDSWRHAGTCGIPMRLLTNRRRNSWTVTRKPSQDSNLSSSRNDSSATTASTNTWRMSRSSVSSDVSNNALVRGGGLKEAGNLKERRSSNPVIGSNYYHPTSTVRQLPSNNGLPSTATMKADGSVAVSARPLLGRPRLTRQAAIQEESYVPPPKSVSFETRRTSCPVHSADAAAAKIRTRDFLQHKYSHLYDSSQDDSSNASHDHQNIPSTEEESLEYPSSEPSSTTVAPTVKPFTPSNFVPRKLSTINSQSCSAGTLVNVGDDSSDADDDIDAGLESDFETSGRWDDNGDSVVEVRSKQGTSPSMNSLRAEAHTETAPSQGQKDEEKFEELEDDVFVEKEEDERAVPPGTTTTENEAERKPLL